MKRDLLWWRRVAGPGVGVAAWATAYAVGRGGPARLTETSSTTTGTVGAQGITLVSYNTCETALRELRGAALPLVGPYGFGGDLAMTDARGGGPVPIVPAVPGAANAPKAAAPEQ